MIRLRLTLDIGRPTPASAPEPVRDVDMTPALVEHADYDDERAIGFRPNIYDPPDEHGGRT